MTVVVEPIDVVVSTNTTDVQVSTTPVSVIVGTSVYVVDGINVTSQINNAIDAHELTRDHPLVTTSLQGFMSAADKVKLDGIQAEANNTTDEQIRDVIGATLVDSTSITWDVDDLLDQIDAHAVFGTTSGTVCEGNDYRLDRALQGNIVASVDYSYNSITILPVGTVSERIVQVLLIVDTPFDAPGATLSVGDVGNTSRLMTTDQNLPQTNSVYQSFPAHKYLTNTVVNLYITPSGSSQGAGTIYLLRN